MGLMDFIADAGKKVSNVVELSGELSRTGVDTQNLTVEMDGDTVKINGNVKTQEEREKIILAAGNINGIAKVDENIDTEDSEAESKFYTVKSGDTLSKIAKTVYGSANKYNIIFEANKPMLESPDKIYVGQVLRIPTL